MVTGGTDARVRIWDVSADELALRHVLTGHGEEATVYGSAVTPSGELAATSGSEGRVILWNLETGARVRSFEAGVRVSELAFGPEGKRLYGASRAGVLVWDAASGARHADLAGYTGAILDLDLRRSTGTLVAACADGTLRVWQVPGGELLRTIESDGDEAMTIALHPRRPLAAAGTKKGALVVWDVESGERVERVVAHEGGVWGVAFDPAGRTLASGGTDKLVRLWRVERAAL